MFPATRVSPIPPVVRGARHRSKGRDFGGGEVAGRVAILMRSGPKRRRPAAPLSLAFLAPGIIESAVDGTLQRGFGLSRPGDPPLGWAAKRAILGLPARD